MVKRSVRWIAFGLGLAMAALALNQAPRLRGVGRPVGDAQAYARLGELPVKHRGRVKPLLSLAIEEIRRIHGRSALTIADEGGEVAIWEPVAALLDWSVRPESWDDRPFIYVDSDPLCRMVLEASARARLIALAATADSEAGELLRTLAGRPEVDSESLRSAARSVGESSAIGRALDALAGRLGGPGDYLSPREIASARIRLGEREVDFPRWADELAERDPALARPTAIEAAAVAVGGRHRRYRAISEHDGPTDDPMDLPAVPRPADERYLQFTTEAFTKGMDPDRVLTPLEANAAEALVAFLRDLPAKSWALPGEEGVFDQEFSTWLGTRAPWLPFGVVRRSEAEELARAGLPSSLIERFREAILTLEAAEREAPVRTSEDVVDAVIDAARNLGVVLADYPEPSRIGREIAFHRRSPFAGGPWAYGVGLALLLAGLGLVAASKPVVENLGAAALGLGMAGLAVGLGLDLWGLLFRYRIVGRVPLENLHDVLTYVGLSSAFVGLAIGLQGRRPVVPAVAGLVALLATAAAEWGPTIDPDALVVVPPTRFNRWLVGHVLMTLSGYAALAVAAGIGFLILSQALVADDGRPGSRPRWALTLLLGLPLVGLGTAGVHGGAAGACLWGLGVFLASLGGFGLIGSIASRWPRRVWSSGLALVVLSATGLAVGLPGRWLIGPGLIGIVLAGFGPLGARKDSAWVEALAWPLAKSLQAGVLFLATGTIVGAAWASAAWDGPWIGDPRVVATLATLSAYLVLLAAHIAGRLGLIGLATGAVLGGLILLISWHGLNFELQVGRHDYGFAEGGSRDAVRGAILALIAFVFAARRRVC